VYVWLELWGAGADPEGFVGGKRWGLGGSTHSTGEGSGPQKKINFLLEMAWFGEF